MKKNYMFSIEEIEKEEEVLPIIKEIQFIDIDSKKLKERIKNALKTYDLTDKTKEGKVTGWIEKNKSTILFIGSEGTIVFPENSRMLLSAHNPFWNLREVEKITFENIDTSEVTDMSYMFSALKAIKELDLSTFNTSHVQIMDDMFEDCISLEKINLKSFNTENVISMEEMFFECSSLEFLDLGSFSTKNVEDFAFMFTGCTRLKVLNLRSFNTEKAKYIGKMFSDCENLMLLDISSFSFDNLDLTQNNYAINHIFGGMSLLANVLVQGKKEKVFLIEHKIIPPYWNEYNLFINE